MNDDLDRFSTWDDTLDDGASPAEVPAEAVPWLARQRFVHGLLRAAHTADAAARESRIASIRARIDAQPSRSRHWFGVVAAALVLACAGFWWLLPASLPTAEAALRRAVAELSRDVDRRFRIESVVAAPKDRELVRHQFLLVSRPGKRFRVEGRFTLLGVPLSEFRLGCDGEQLWLLPVNGMARRSVPLAEHERLLHGLSDVLDLGYLDVHELAGRLPTDFELRVAGRTLGADGRPKLRIETGGRRTAGWMQLRTAWLSVDEASGMIEHLEAVAEFPHGSTRRIVFEYLGDEPPGLVDYRRPW